MGRGALKTRNADESLKEPEIKGRLNLREGMGHGYRSVKCILNVTKVC